MSGFNPRNPNKYQGTDQFLIPFISRPREPTGADYRQPETGRLYALGSIWQVAKNPTTGVEGDLWMLSKIVANVAYWIKVSGGSIGPLLEVQVDAATVPGVNPVTPDGLGLMTVRGSIVANQAIPIRTHTTALNEYDVEVQYATATAATNADLPGLAAFNSAHFSVDADGFVSLLGGGNAIDQINVDASTAPGTDPVVPDVNGEVTVTGGQVAAGTTANVIRTNSLAANTYTIEIQRSSEQAVSTIGANGVSHFNSSMFDVDANGFVQLSELYAFNYVQINNASSPYTATATDYYIACDSSGGAITIRLPNAPTLYRRFIIKDRTGSASTNNISVTTVGGAVTIDGLTTYPISGNYGSIQLLFNSSAYEVF